MKKSPLQEMFGLLFAVSLFTWLVAKPSRRSKTTSGSPIGCGSIFFLGLVIALIATESTRVLGIGLLLVIVAGVVVAVSKGKLNVKPPVAPSTRRTGEVFYMPPLDKSQPAIGKIDEKPPHPAAATLGSAKNTLAFGDPFEIVGESFYGNNFETLRHGLGFVLGEEHEVLLTLMNEPANINSKSGKAVAVYCNGLKLGHIADDENSPFFDTIQTVGGVAICHGKIWFDDEADIDDRTNSVELLVAWPPRLEGTL